MKHNEFKDCPFCGADGRFIDIHYSILDGEDHHAQCGVCLVSTKLFRTRRGAVNAWNRRTK